MSITYDWDIAEVTYTNDNNKIITWASVVVTGTDGNASAEWTGKVKFNPNTNNGEFTDYSQVTKDQVISWVKSHIISEEIEEFISSKIQQPSSLTGLPWNE